MAFIVLLTLLSGLSSFLLTLSSLAWPGLLAQWFGTRLSSLMFAMVPVLSFCSILSYLLIVRSNTCLPIPRRRMAVIAAIIRLITVVIYGIVSAIATLLPPC